jgi:hypothetical protein
MPVRIVEEPEDILRELRELCDGRVVGWHVNGGSSEPFASRVGFVKALTLSEGGWLELSGLAPDGKTEWNYKPGANMSMRGASIHYGEDGSIHISGPFMAGIGYVLRPLGSN